MSEEAFAEYVAGKTIAIIGPAPFRRADIELALDHDLIYRVSFFPWEGPVHIQYLSRGVMRSWVQSQQPIPGDWIVTKTVLRQELNTTAQIRNNRVPINGKMNPNQVTAAIMDLCHFEPEDVNVYGADLYVSGPSGIYRPGYCDGTADSRHWASLHGHRPWLQHETARGIMLDKGWFSSSTAYREVLEMDTKAYWARIKQVWGRSEPARPGWVA